MTDQEIEPDAWMSYNGMGGAGLVPYLVKSRAEHSTNLSAGGPPPTLDTQDWPQPLFSSETILEHVNDRIEQINQRKQDASDSQRFRLDIVQLELEGLKEVFSQ